MDATRLLMVRLPSITMEVCCTLRGSSMVMRSISLISTRTDRVWKSLWYTKSGLMVLIVGMPVLARFSTARWIEMIPGRGVAADIDGRHRGFEMWSLDSKEVRDCHGKVIADDPSQMPAMNFRIYWDGDLQDELLANGRRPHFAPYLQKWNGKKAVPLPLSNGKHLSEMGHSVSNNWTKSYA